MSITDFLKDNGNLGTREKIDLRTAVSLRGSAT
jgi:hypothetical protein